MSALGVPRCGIDHLECARKGEAEAADQLGKAGRGLALNDTSSGG
jgi:hypothetical protein